MIPTVQGARLAYVVKKLEGTVKRTHFKFDRRTRKLVPNEVEEDAGWLVFFPQGHYLRVRTKQDLIRYKLNYKPQIISMTGLTDPNTPVGRLMMAQDEGEREKAWGDMEADIAAMVRRRSGPMSIPGYDKKLPIPTRSEEVSYA
ncbi:MAG: hypothetical protein MN733_03475 [Nitrososphaera sp.]|nr:hypothetical protein [Nitrososphaera sp.]